MLTLMLIVIHVMSYYFVNLRFGLTLIIRRRSIDSTVLLIVSTDNFFIAFVTPLWNYK